MERPHRGIHRFWKVREGGREGGEGGRGRGSFGPGMERSPLDIHRVWKVRKGGREGGRGGGVMMTTIRRTHFKHPSLPPSLPPSIPPLA